MNDEIFGLLGIAENKTPIPNAYIKNEGKNNENSGQHGTNNPNEQKMSQQNANYMRNASNNGQQNSRSQNAQQRKNDKQNGPGGKLKKQAMKRGLRLDPDKPRRQHNLDMENPQMAAWLASGAQAMIGSNNLPSFGIQGAFAPNTLYTLIIRMNNQASFVPETPVANAVQQEAQQQQPTLVNVLPQPQHMANNSAGFDITGAQQQQQNFSHYGVNNIQAQNVPGYQQQDQGHMRTQSNFGEVDASFAGGYGDQNSHAHQKGRHGSGKGGERKGSNKKGKGSGKKGANGKHYQAVENNNESAAHLQTQNIAAESSGTSYYTASASSQIAKDINGSANQQQQNLVPAGFNPGLHNQPGFQVTAAIQNSGKKNSQNANNSSNAKKAAQEDHEAAVNSFEEIQDDQVLSQLLAPEGVVGNSFERLPPGSENRTEGDNQQQNQQSQQNPATAVNSSQGTSDFVQQFQQNLVAQQQAISGGNTTQQNATLTPLPANVDISALNNSTNSLTISQNSINMLGASFDATNANLMASLGSSIHTHPNSAAAQEYQSFILQQQIQQQLQIQSQQNANLAAQQQNAQAAQAQAAAAAAANTNSSGLFMEQLAIENNNFFNPGQGPNAATGANNFANAVNQNSQATNFQIPLQSAGANLNVPSNSKCFGLGSNSPMSTLLAMPTAENPSITGKTARMLQKSGKDCTTMENGRQIVMSDAMKPPQIGGANGQNGNSSAYDQNGNGIVQNPHGNRNGNSANKPISFFREANSHTCVVAGPGVGTNQLEMSAHARVYNYNNNSSNANSAAKNSGKSVNMNLDNVEIRSLGSDRAQHTISSSSSLSPTARLRQPGDSFYSKNAIMPIDLEKLEPHERILARNARSLSPLRYHDACMGYLYDVNGEEGYSAEILPRNFYGLDFDQSLYLTGVERQNALIRSESADAVLQIESTDIHQDGEATARKRNSVQLIMADSPMANAKSLLSPESKKRTSPDIENTNDSTNSNNDENETDGTCKRKDSSGKKYSFFITPAKDSGKKNSVEKNAVRASTDRKSVVKALVSERKSISKADRLRNFEIQGNFGNFSARARRSDMYSKMMVPSARATTANLYAMNTKLTRESHTLADRHRTLCGYPGAARTSLNMLARHSDRKYHSAMMRVSNSGLNNAVKAGLKKQLLFHRDLTERSAEIAKNRRSLPLHILQNITPENRRSSILASAEKTDVLNNRETHVMDQSPAESLYNGSECYPMYCNNKRQSLASLRDYVEPRNCGSTVKKNGPRLRMPNLMQDTEGGGEVRDLTNLICATSPSPDHKLSNANRVSKSSKVLAASPKQMLNEANAVANFLRTPLKTPIKEKLLLNCSSEKANAYNKSLMRTSSTKDESHGSEVGRRDSDSLYSRAPATSIGTSASFHNLLNPHSLQSSQMKSKRSLNSINANHGSILLKKNSVNHSLLSHSNALFAHAYRRTDTSQNSIGSKSGPALFAPCLRASPNLNALRHSRVASAGSAPWIALVLARDCIEDSEYFEKKEVALIFSNWKKETLISLRLKNTNRVSTMSSAPVAIEPENSKFIRQNTMPEKSALNTVASRAAHSHVIFPNSLSERLSAQKEADDCEVDLLLQNIAPNGLPVESNPLLKAQHAFLTSNSGRVSTSNGSFVPLPAAHKAALAGGALNKTSSTVLVPRNTEQLFRNSTVAHDSKTTVLSGGSGLTPVSETGANSADPRKSFRKSGVAIPVASSSVNSAGTNSVVQDKSKSMVMMSMTGTKIPSKKRRMMALSEKTNYDPPAMPRELLLGRNSAAPTSSVATAGPSSRHSAKIPPPPPPPASSDALAVARAQSLNLAGLDVGFHGEAPDRHSYAHEYAPDAYALQQQAYGLSAEEQHAHAMAAYHHQQMMAAGASPYTNPAGSASQYSSRAGDLMLPRAQSHTAGVSSNNAARVLSYEHLMARDNSLVEPTVTNLYATGFGRKTVSAIEAESSTMKDRSSFLVKRPPPGMEDLTKISCKDENNSSLLKPSTKPFEGVTTPPPGLAPETDENSRNSSVTKISSNSVKSPILMQSPFAWDDKDTFNSALKSTQQKLYKISETPQRIPVTTNRGEMQRAPLHKTYTRDIMLLMKELSLKEGQRNGKIGTPLKDDFSVEARGTCPGALQNIKLMPAKMMWKIKGRNTTQPGL